MIHGDGTLADTLRAYYGDVSFTWIAWDTPINADGTPDTKYVLDAAFEVLDHGLHDDVILSSQLPVGTCAKFEARWPFRNFYVVPENVRVAHAYADWTHQARVIVGARRERFQFDRLWAPVTSEIIHVSPETAELTKHALNGFLALSVEYAQEIAHLAREHGADPGDLAQCVMSDERIGTKAYLRPSGEPGPHLMREVHTLAALGGGRLIDALAR